MKNIILSVIIIITCITITNAQMLPAINCQECPIINANDPEANCTTFEPRYVPVKYTKRVYQSGGNFTFETYGAGEFNRIRPEQPVILFFHGINSDGDGCWQKMISNFSQQVFPSLVTLSGSKKSFDPVYVSVDLDGKGYRCPNAEKILFVFEDVIKKIPACNSIYIVTHSKGSLDNLLALYLSHKRNSTIDQQFKSRLRRVFNLAPPHGGSPIPDEITNYYKKGFSSMGPGQGIAFIAGVLAGHKQHLDLTTANSRKYIEMYEKAIASTYDPKKRFNPPVSTIGAWDYTQPVPGGGATNTAMHIGGRILEKNFGFDCSKGGNDGAVPYPSTTAIKFATEEFPGGCVRQHPQTKVNHSGIQPQFDIAFAIGTYIYKTEREMVQNKICPLISYNEPIIGNPIDLVSLAEPITSYKFSNYVETISSSAGDDGGPSLMNEVVAFDPAVFESEVGLLRLNPNFSSGKYTYVNGAPIQMSLYAEDEFNQPVNQANIYSYAYNYDDPSNEIPVTFYNNGSGNYIMEPIALPEGSYGILVDAESEAERFYKSASYSFAVTNGLPFQFEQANTTSILFECEICSPDAGVTEIQVNENYETSITPKVKFTNHGDVTIYNTTFAYSFDNGEKKSFESIKWEGELEKGAITENFIDLETINIPAGATKLWVYTSSPNEIEGDDRDKNNDGKEYLLCKQNITISSLQVDERLGINADQKAVVVQFENIGSKTASANSITVRILMERTETQETILSSEQTYAWDRTPGSIGEIKFPFYNLSSGTYKVTAELIDRSSGAGCEAKEQRTINYVKCDNKASLTSIDIDHTDVVLSGEETEDMDFTPSAVIQNEEQSTIYNVEARYTITKTGNNSTEILNTVQTFDLNIDKYKNGTIEFDHVKLSTGKYTVTCELLKLNGQEAKCGSKLKMQRDISVCEKDLAVLYYNYKVKSTRRQTNSDGSGYIAEYKVVPQITIQNKGLRKVATTEIVAKTKAGLDLGKANTPEFIYPGEKVTISLPEATLEPKEYEVKAYLSDARSYNDCEINNDTTTGLMILSPANFPAAPSGTGCTLIETIYWGGERTSVSYHWECQSGPGILLPKEIAGHGREHSNPEVTPIHQTIDDYFEGRNNLTAAEVQQTIDNYYGKTISAPVAQAQGVNELVLFPNPTNGMLTIAYASGSTNTIVTIQNMLGQTVVREEGAMGNNQHLVDLSKYDNGMYIVQIMDGKNTIIKKVTLTKNQ